MSEIDGEYTSLIVAQGRGWGGDGKHHHWTHLEYYDKDGELHMMHLTNPQLVKLIEILIPASACAWKMDLEETLARYSLGNVQKDEVAGRQKNE